MPSRSNHGRACASAAARFAPPSSNASATFSSADSSGTSWPNWNTNPKRSRRRRLRSVSFGHDRLKFASLVFSVLAVPGPDAGVAVRTAMVVAAYAVPGSVTASAVPRTSAAASGDRWDFFAIAFFLTT
ncbi:hypothetical protein FrEUN1fDRAFT_1771 [Parafrankia sp. EUN1f]|nr:hypothetical protein FrEUN1fDRAFT_1771 [Parafrankia sp. EUN1f]